jgi:uncharacterized protein YprB with RNaseH-like and TPR domain
MLSPFLLENLARLQLAPHAATAPAAPAPLNADTLPGCEMGSDDGRFWCVDRSLHSLLREDSNPARAQLCRAHPQAAEHHDDLIFLRNCYPRGALLLDLETCGFAGSAIFLIGLLHWKQGEWRLAQLLARDYSEELAILQHLHALAADKSVLVSFNGKSFDGPMIEDRRARYRLEPCTPRLRHCDLLHHARRRWRKQLPDCKLQTLERWICQRQRRGDISGAQVPLAYHAYVRTGDVRALREILHHNALDLITLLQLAEVLMPGISS